MVKPFREEPLGSVRVALMNLSEAARFLAHSAAVGRPELAFTLNTHHLWLLRTDPQFAKAYSKATVVFPDGWPILALMFLQGSRGRGRVTGADLLPAVAGEARNLGQRIGLIGAAPGVAARVRDRLVATVPGLKPPSVLVPPEGFEDDARECEALADFASSLDVVFLALGSPKQELVAAQHLLGVTTTIACGAAFDFFVDEQRRPNKLWQRLGLEWFRRWAGDPRRLTRRYGRAAFNLLFRELPSSTARRLQGAAGSRQEESSNTG